MREIARDGPWAGRLLAADAARTPLGPPAWYHAALRPHCRRVDVWRTTYHHLLADHHAVVEWFLGSALRPYLAPLAPDEREEFLARYERSVSALVPPLAGGGVLLPYPRLFLVATR